MLIQKCRQILWSLAMSLLFHNSLISLYRFILGALDYNNTYLGAINGLTPLSKIDNCKYRLISIKKL